MQVCNLLLMAGDGIGPEVMQQVRRCGQWLTDRQICRFDMEEELVGGSSYDDCGSPLSDRALSSARDADVVMLGAVGGPKWNEVAFDLRPEAGLMSLRKELDLFANLRPAICYEALSKASSLKVDIVSGLDILIVRELTGGIYFGQPRGIEDKADGQRRGVNTHVYTSSEIRRVAKIAFELARTRSGRVTSVEKRNVMEAGQLWYEEVSELHTDQFQDVHLSHMLADNCAMQLVRQPKQFDVIVTDNLFGDILSDVAAMLTGSLGMLPSASLGSVGPSGKANALYEPVHGSAPDIAGTGKANPLAMIGSFAMALRYSLNLPDVAAALDMAIADVLASGVRTVDIAEQGQSAVSSDEMGTAVLDALAQRIQEA